MPPSFVKSVRELIFWEYAKLIADAAGFHKQYGFIVSSYKKLLSGEKKMSSLSKEDELILRGEKICIYCRSTLNLQLDHLIPKKRGGPDNIHNKVWTCRACNLSKGCKDIFEWYENKDKIPRIVKAKYLKLVYEFHKNMGTLERSDINKDGKLDVKDLNIFNILFLAWEE